MINKNQIKKELAGMRNNTKFIFGVNVARVCWNDDNQYMVIENEENFEDASAQGFTPIQAYRTQQELIDSLYKVLN